MSDYIIEPLEDPKNARLFIIADKQVPEFKAYLQAKENFWTEDEINASLKTDSAQIESLEQKILFLIKHQIAFFIIGDGKVNEIIECYLSSRITDREVQTWYNFQESMEDIHNLTYMKLFDTYVTEPNEREVILNAVDSYPIIGRKIDWLKKWLGDDNDIHKLNDPTIESIKELRNVYLKSLEFSKGFVVDSEVEIPEHLQTLFQKLDEPKPLLAKQILINLIMEGLFFSGSFCIIFWVNHTYGKLPGLTKANEFISRDEGMHTDFGIGLYNRRILNRLSQELVHEIMGEAVDLESEFMAEALPKGLLNMNANLMTQYIQYVADGLLSDLGYDKLYSVENPFDFMKKQSVSVRISDFFVDPNVSEYGNAFVGTNTEDQEVDFGEDF